MKIGDWVKVVENYHNVELLGRSGQISSDKVAGFLCVRFDGWTHGHDGTPASNGIGPHWWFPPSCLELDETFIMKKILETYDRTESNS